MINFFRQIRKSLLEKDGFTKYLFYAIGEIFLVVIGILIALQINNWNAEKKDNQKEQKILGILKSEFIYNQKELERNIKKATSLQQRADSLLAFFHKPKEQLDSIKLSAFIYGLSSYSTYDPSNGALTNLISSGELNLIKNDSLRIILSKWFGEVQDVKEDEVRLMDFGDTHLEPLRLEFMSYVKDSKFERNGFTILDNPQFENIVGRMSNRANYIVKNYEVLGNEINIILTLIKNEIKQ